MTVSVVIPCHNMLDTLPHAVESALPDAGEVLIYDDASVEDMDSIWALCAKYNRVRFVPSVSAVPIGVCAARNILVTRAVFDWILPLDADDYFLPGGIRTLLQARNKNTFVYGGWRDSRGYHPPPPIGMLTRKNVSKGTFLFSRADWQRVGGYLPMFNVGAEDYAFMLALHQAGVNGISVDVAVYQYTDNPTGRAAACKPRWPLIQELIQSHYGIRP